MTATVKYQIATYAGTVYVSYEEEDDDETIIAKAKNQLRRRIGTFPFGYQSFKVTKR